MMEDIHSKLQEIKSPVNVIGMLIREMDYETDVEMDRGFSPGERRTALASPSHPQHSDWIDATEVNTCFLPLSTVQPINVRMHLSQLYGSSTTVNMVCRCVYKMSMTRFLICRDLLILQQLLLRLGDAVSISNTNILRNPKTSYLWKTLGAHFMIEGKK